TGDKAVFSCAAMHDNPILCLGGWMGILLMHRFIKMKEPFPDYLLPDDFMERSVLRSAKSFKTATEYETQNSYHHKAFELIGLESSKITHLNRGVMQRDMNDYGLWSEIGRHVGYENSCQVNNYCPNKPPQAIAFCAGAADFSTIPALRKFWPARTRIGAIPDDGMKSVCRYVFMVSVLLPHRLSTLAKCCTAKKNF
ncbi:MAG: hypothetical protein ACREBR_00950, partial [bacterium]